MSRPCAVKIAAACRPPVRSKVSCDRRSCSGKLASVLAFTASFDLTGLKCRCTASIVAFPHNPQLDEANTCRVSCAKSTVTLGDRKTLMTLPSLLRGCNAIRAMSVRLLTSPSVSKKPAANS
jgi:hypothetical protein